jgi:hypothetical protein
MKLNILNSSFLLSTPLEDIQFLQQGGKMEKNAKLFQDEMPEELKDEMHALYNLGIKSYEVEYILSLKNKD